MPFFVNGSYRGAVGKSFLCYDGHPGIDYSAPIGTSVYAAADGIVVDFRPDIPDNKYIKESLGNFIVIAHTDFNLRTVYGHLKQNSLRVVRQGMELQLTKGMQVFRGEKIAESDNTGDSSGDHLHFEVQSNDKELTRLDPYGWKGWLIQTDPYPAINRDLWKCEFVVGQQGAEPLAPGKIGRAHV